MPESSAMRWDFISYSEDSKRANIEFFERMLAENPDDEEVLLLIDIIRSNEYIDIHIIREFLDRYINEGIIKYDDSDEIPIVCDNLYECLKNPIEYVNKSTKFISHYDNCKSEFLKEKLEAKERYELSVITAWRAIVRAGYECKKAEDQEQCARAYDIAKNAIEEAHKEYFAWQKAQKNMIILTNLIFLKSLMR